MQRMVGMLSVVILVCSAIVALLFFSPATLETTYKRVVENANNETAGASSDGWPLKMKLHRVVFTCSVASPNLDVSEDQLNSAWQLPPRTRLSPLMRRVGHCKLGAQHSRDKAVYTYDGRKCNCIDATWTAFVFGIAIASIFFYCLVLIAAESNPDEDNGKELSKLRGSRCVAGCWAMVWYVAMWIYALRNVDAGLSYTLYGHMYPQPYYMVEPDNWFVTFVLCMVNCWAEGTKYLIYGSAVRKATKQQAIEAAREPTPPAYETLRFWQV